MPICFPYHSDLIKNIDSVDSITTAPNAIMTSPMDQFEIKPFFGEFLGLNYTPVGMFTNILVYIGLVATFTIFFYIYGSFKESIKLNG